MKDENTQNSLADEVKAQKVKNQIKINTILAHLPKETITYTQNPTPTMDIPYTLTAKDYTEFYLEDKRLPDLTPEEQLILLTTSITEPTRTQGEMLSGIYKAREAHKRARNYDEAIKFVNKFATKSNLALTAFVDKVGRHRINAEKLQYYLDASDEQSQYLMKEDSKIFNLKNKIKQFFTKKPYTEPPYTQDELEKGAKAWRKFRKAQNASPETTAEDLLNIYRYGTDHPTRDEHRKYFS